VAWWVLGSRDADPAPTPTPNVQQPITPPVDPGAPSTEPPAEVPITDLTNGTAVPDDVAGLLERAKGYVRLGLVERGRRLASPPGDNAIDLFQRVLSLEPDNAEALAGLGQVAAFYESRAQAAYDRGIYNSSMVLAEEGLRAQPDSASLRKLVEDSRRALPQ
jgi:tetratricopeptide (TPR) repeat protein